MFLTEGIIFTSYLTDIRVFDFCCYLQQQNMSFKRFYRPKLSIIATKSTSLLFTVVKYMSEKFCHVNFSTQLFCDVKMNKILIFTDLKLQQFK